MSEGRLIERPIDAMEFMLAGNATITVVSKRTKKRYTYRIQQSKDKRVHFVSVMYGPDNESNYVYMGMLNNGVFKQTAKSKVFPQDPRWVAFVWVLQHLRNATAMPNELEVWHEGRCGRCGAKLTVPASIESGYGPECVKIRQRRT